MKILYRPYVLRSIAAFLLVESLSQVCLPSLSYALTSGPTVPETTSFEPVDTTDMVDMASGDFTYNIPLIEVPGPEGGYPLSLSYHAGIKPNEDASWVGLGWSFNPGAISRNVNGYADDHESVSQTRRDYWEGGDRQTVGVGVTFGPKNMPTGFSAGVSFGLTFSQDTYRGFGVGANMSVSATMTGDPKKYGASGLGSVGVNAFVSTDGYGNDNAGVGIAASAKLVAGVSATMGAGFSTAGGGSESAGLRGYGLGVSMSSTNSTPRISVAGGTATVSSAKAGLLQTETSSFTAPIPFPGGTVDLSYSDTRYWSDETVDVYANGSLYYPKQYIGNGEYFTSSGRHDRYEFDNRAFDTYYLPDPENENIFDNPDPEWLQGGSFADYDNYVVTGQGLSGSMRPYSYQQSLYSQNKISDPTNKIYSILDVPLPWNNKPMNFRFDNDFSNQYRQTSTGALLAPQRYSVSQQNMPMETQYNFDNQPQRGEASGLGYDASNDRIAGTKSVEWFTNSQIYNNAATTQGFIDQQALGFVRDNNSQIGGFSITNSSGVTYHYSLPVYSYGEQVYTEKIGSNGGTFTQITKPNKYAYTWLLTAVTGPDYVDKDGNGLVNEGDWGYWVSYMYGKWVGDYQWRNPSQGYHRDMDASFQSFSSGKKEIYYLNSIKTRTHTALFVKSFRADAKGATPSVPFFANSNNFRIRRNVIPLLNDEIYAFPAMQLKLDKILLLKNEDVPTNICQSATDYDFTNIAYTSSGHRVSSIGRSFTGQNILDVADINQVNTTAAANGIPTLLAKSQKSISFSYNYSLCTNTINSWASDAANYVANYTDYSQLAGKLTLAAVQSFGVSGAAAIPPTSFGYELSESEKRITSVTVSQSPVNLQGTLAVNGTNNLVVGDLLQLTGSGANNVYYCTVTGINGTSGNSYSVTYLNNGPPAGNTYIASTTKNPPYAKDSYDMWEMFKGDFNIDLTELAGHDETMARTTSAISALNTDVWSLRQVRTPLGALIKLKYGSDTYRTKVLRRPNMIADFGAKDFYSYCFAEGDSPGEGHITFGNRLKVPASTIFHQYQPIMISGIMSKSFDNNSIPWATKDDLPVIVTAVLDKGPNNYTNVVYIRDDSGTLFQPHPDASHPYRPIQMGHVKFFENPDISYGGGIRVEEVSVITSDVKKTTKYSYNNNGLPSGTTSYEPSSYLPMNKAMYDNLVTSYPDVTSAANEYKNNYYKTLPTLLSLAREVPAPGVMYEFVTVQDAIQRKGENEVVSPQKVTYQLEVFKPNMIGVLGPHSTSTPRTNYEIRTREVAIHDFTSRIGRLKRRTTYNAAGVKLSEMVNHYLHDDLDNASIAENVSTANTGYAAKMSQFGYIGMIQEVFGDSRYTRRTNGESDVKVVMSHRNVYPVVLTSTTTTDFKTNVSVTSENKQFDFLSGAVTKVLTTDSYGNHILDETTPAYRIYPALGPKMGSNGGRNMFEVVG